MSNENREQATPVREFGVDALLARLGSLAKQRREELGYSRPAFAKASGIGSDKTVAEFEFGRRLPQGGTLRKFESGLGWRLGVIDDILREVNRKASSVEMTDLDSFDLETPKDSNAVLKNIGTAELLEELLNRLPRLQWEVSRLAELRASQGPGMPAQDLFGLAANSDPSHLEREAEDGEA